MNNMYLIYIDESYDEKHYAYSALFIDAFQWNYYFSHVLQWRSQWQQKHDIPLDFELHATKFVGGRGEFPKNRDKSYRAKLFYEAIGQIERMRKIYVINAITSDKKRHMILFERMLNRIDRTLDAINAYGLLICDEGNENRLTSLVRKMKKQNNIPCSVELYGNLGNTRNVPLQRVIEDPLFKTSKSSYFIQLSDFLAFSLLRNESPTSSTVYQVQSAFEQLDTVLVKIAFKNDPKGKGIIRV